MPKATNTSSTPTLRGRGHRPPLNVRPVTVNIDACRPASSPMPPAQQATAITDPAIVTVTSKRDRIRRREEADPSSRGVARGRGGGRGVDRPYDAPARRPDAGGSPAFGGGVP